MEKPTETLFAWAIVYDSPKWKKRFFVVSDIFRTRAEAIRSAEKGFQQSWRQLKRQGQSCERVVVQVLAEIE
jgi:hypothetical protein